MEALGKDQSQRDEVTMASVEQRKEFVGRLYDVLEGVLLADENNNLRENFRSTFEARKKAPWLEESSGPFGENKESAPHGMANVFNTWTLRNAWPYNMKNPSLYLSDPQISGERSVDAEFETNLAEGLWLGRQQALECEEADRGTVSRPIADQLLSDYYDTTLSTEDRTLEA